MKKLLIMIALVQVLFANVANVVFLKGDASVNREGSIKKLALDFKINKQDIVKTKNNGHVQLKFSDNTLITIGKNSSFSINEYLYDEKQPKKSSAKFKFSKGLFRTVTGKIGKINPKLFTIKAKNSTIGIRGTTFDVFVGAKNVKVSVLDGAVYFDDGKKVIDINVNEALIYNPKLQKGAKKKGQIIESVEFEEFNFPVSEDDKEEIIKTNEIEGTASIELIEEYVKQVASGVAVDSPYADTPTDLPNLPTLNEADPNLEKESVATGFTDIDFGYWQDITQNNLRVDTYVTGEVTPDFVVEDYIVNNQSANYHGDIASIVTNTDGSKISSSGSIQLDFDFSNQTMSGDMIIDEGNWRANINTGSVGTSSFNSSDITAGPTSSVTNISGSLDGNFYGDNAQNAGGSFSLSSGSQSVDGVFGAQK